MGHFLFQKLHSLVLKLYLTLTSQEMKLVSNLLKLKRIKDKNANKTHSGKIQTYKNSGVESKDRPPKSMGYLNIRKK